MSTAGFFLQFFLAAGWVFAQHQKGNHSLARRHCEGNDSDEAIYESIPLKEEKTFSVKSHWIASAVVTSPRNDEVIKSLKILTNKKLALIALILVLVS